MNKLLRNHSKEFKEVNDEEGKQYEKLCEHVYLIQEKHGLPKMGLIFFGEDITETTTVTEHMNLDFQTVKKWITAAAYGKLTYFQLNTWFGECHEFDYMDPYWLMLGVPYYWSKKWKEVFNSSEEINSTILALCTRNKHKAKPLPKLGYGGWCVPKMVIPCGKKYMKKLWNDRMVEARQAKDEECIKRLNRDKDYYYNYDNSNSLFCNLFVFGPKT